MSAGKAFSLSVHVHCPPDWVLRGITKSLCVQCMVFLFGVFGLELAGVQQTLVDYNVSLVSNSVCFSVAFTYRPLLLKRTLVLFVIDFRWLCSSQKSFYSQELLRLHRSWDWFFFSSGTTVSRRQTVASVVTCLHAFPLVHLSMSFVSCS